MAPKAPSDFTVAEVGMWLTAIGLGNKAPEFQENGIDGPMLVALTDQDLQTDLGLQNLQLRKFRISLDFSNDLVAGGGGADPSRVAQLEAENAQLKNKVADLQAIIKTVQGDQTPPPPPKAAPAPAPAPSSRPPPRGHPVVAGAAGGAARGALLGAVGGAIAGDAGKGAKMGAAMGATGGGLRGLGARRRMR